MKIISVISFVFSFLLISCNNKISPDESKEERPAKIEFERTAYDFGTLQAGEVAEFTFMFKNTGTLPLRLVSADSDCGCTISKWDKQPIQENESGKITVTFDTQGFTGNMFKTVTVKTNTGETIELRIGALIISNIELRENY